MKRTMWLVVGVLLLVSVLVWAESYPVNQKIQLSTEANCKLLLHMNETSWNGTLNEVKDASGCSNHGQAFGGVTTIAGGTNLIAAADMARLYTGVGGEDPPADSHPSVWQLLLGGSWFDSGGLKHSDWCRFKRGTDE